MTSLPPDVAKNITVLPFRLWLSIKVLMILGLVDAFSSNVLLTLGALLAVLFVGWKMKREDVQDELTNCGTANRRSFKVIYFLLRYIAPIAIIVIFVSNFI